MLNLCSLRSTDQKPEARAAARQAALAAGKEKKKDAATKKDKVCFNRNRCFVM
jgi:hypothetical protein